MGPRGLRRLLGSVFAVVAVALVGWSAWLYHFAADASTTDETPSSWIAIGTLALVGGLLSIRIALRLFRGRPTP